MNITEARDAIYGLIKAGWEGNPSSAPVAVLYPDVGQDKPKGQDAITQAAEPYMVARAELNGGGQETLADQSGLTKFGRFGIASLQINAPMGTGQTLLDQLVQSGLDIFEGKAAGSVWFRNTRPVDVGQVGEYFRTLVLTEFEFDQYK